MNYILISLVSGVILGVIFRKQPIGRITNPGLKLLVLLLLFLMGTQLGQNTKVWESAGSMSIAALAITVCSILGSIFAVKLYYFLVKRK